MSAALCDGFAELTNMGPTNRSIITNMRATRLEEADRIAFMQQYIAKNGTLNGADAQWRSLHRYEPVHPPTPDPGRRNVLFMNDGRTPWAQYFAGAGQGAALRRQLDPTARPSPQPAARPAATPNGPPGHARPHPSPPLAPR